MRNYVIQRVLWIFLILFTTLTITFTLLKLAPEYPPSKVEDKDAWLERQVQDGYYTVKYYDATNQLEVDKAESIRATDPDLNKTLFFIFPIDDSRIIKEFRRVPISVQYFRWLKNIVTDWNWGYSTQIRANTPAFDIIKERIPLTLSLNIVILIFYLPFGFILGIVSALKKDSVFDNILQTIIMIFLSLPSLIFLLLLIILFAYKMDNFLPSLFPLIGIQSRQEIARGYIIPMLAVGLPAIASFTRLLRAELSEVLTSEYVLLAKTKGLSHSQAVLRHAIRNSLVPMVPIIIGSFAGLLSGSFIMESVYAIPGVGTITLRALAKGAYDYNVIMSSSAFYSSITLFTLLIMDLSYGIIDPRIRMGAKK